MGLWDSIKNIMTIPDDDETENEIVESARTAAEAQMRYSSAPVMNFPVESESSDIPSVTGNAVQSE